ncbi:MAG TPA: M6 family metalloprotease domain-containing protein [Euryarchaeota archaeon]|nr:M6 family metalloprotease domain-containing protein [Euryarchaeota archaeon]
MDWLKALFLLLATLLVMPAGAVTPYNESCGAAARPVDTEGGTNLTRGENTRAGERNPITGTLKVLVIAIEFTDVNHTMSLSTFESRISGMDSYYREVSYGNVSITGDVAPKWYRSSRTMAYYGADAGGGHDNANVPIYYLVLEAIDLANPDINYHDYDTDGDGYLDHLIVVHAGRDQASSGDPNDIWSHRGNLNAYKDGVYITSYVLVSEFSPLSVFCHEFGHDLLLPDLYDYGYDSDGLGVWSLMAGGTVYGSSPAHFDPWCKYYLGWIEPIEVIDNMKDVVIPPVERYPVVYKLKISDTEYFLVENRQQISYDRYLPGRGLLIYHVDEARWSPDINDIRHWRPNEDENHKFIDIEESTPRQDLDLGYTEGDYNQGDSTDPWLNSEEGFWFGSNPNSTSYYTPWKDSEIAIRNIRPSGDNMIADLIIQKRVLTALLRTATDVEARPGESVVFRFDVSSNRRIGDSITVDLRGNHLEWVGPYTVHFNLSGPGDTFTVTITVTVPQMTLAGYSGRYTVRFLSSDGTTTPTLSFNVTVKRTSSISIFTEEQVNFTEPEAKSVDISILSMSNFDEEISLSYQLSGDLPDGYRITSLPESVRIPPFSWYNFTITVTLTEDGRGDSTTLLRIMAVSTSTEYSNSTVVKLFVESVHNLEVIPLTPLPLQLSPGEEGFIDFQVRNTGNVEERIEVVLKGPHGWTVSASPTGRIYIQPSSAKKITLTVGAPQDALYIEDGYRVNVTLYGQETLRFNFTVMVRKVPAVSLESTPDRLGLKPYEAGNFTVSVRNTGNVEISLALRVLDLPHGLEHSLERNPVRVLPGETVQINLTLRVASMLSPGIYSFTFEGYSTQFSLSERIDLSVEVLLLSRITVTDFPEQVEVAGSGEGSFWINNDGNGEVILFLSGDFPEALKLSFYDQAGTAISSVVIPRGSRVVVRFKIAVDGRISPGRYTGNISITTKDGEEFRFPLVVDVKGSESGGGSGAGVYLLFVVVGAVGAVAAAFLFILMRRRSGATEHMHPGGGEVDDRKKLAELMGELNRRLEESDSVWAKIHRDAALEALNRGDTEKALEEINEAFKSL